MGAKFAAQHGGAHTTRLRRPGRARPASGAT
jgi:hypothetical protein